VLVFLITLYLSLCVGQCEYSFSKTNIIMEMNKKEMERYEEVYGYAAS